ncbi:hypothetical protein Tco_0401796 [Tanacetum coccineum]
MGTRTPILIPEIVETNFRAEAMSNQSCPEQTIIGPDKEDPHAQIRILQTNPLHMRFVTANTASTIRVRTLPGNTVLTLENTLKLSLPESGVDDQGPPIPTFSSEVQSPNVDKRTNCHLHAHKVPDTVQPSGLRRIHGQLHSHDANKIDVIDMAGEYLKKFLKEHKPLVKAKTIEPSVMNLPRLNSRNCLPQSEVINPEFCTHKILMEEDYAPAVQHQRRVNPKIHDVIKKEVEKLLEAGLIYPSSDIPVSPVQIVYQRRRNNCGSDEENEVGFQLFGLP